MFQKMQLGKRVMIQIGGAAVLIIALTITFVGWSAGRQARNNTDATLEEMAGRYGARVEAEIEVAMNAARTMAQSFESMRAIRAERVTYDAILRGIVESNASFIGVWTCWEPDALVGSDGKDADFAGTKGHDDTGRFIPYWNRAGGQVSREPLVDYDKPGAGDYYQLCLKSGEETVLDPYEYELDGKKQLLTSVVAPIQFKNQTIAVAGVDMTMTRFNDMIRQIKPWDVGYAFLVSNNGTFVAHPNDELIGKNMKAYGAGPEVLDGVRSGKTVVQMKESVATGETSIVRFVPVQIGNAQTPWSLAVTVPVSRVMQEARALAIGAAGIGFVGVLVLLGLVWLITRSITNPLNRAIASLTAGSEQVSSASSQISQSSQQLAEGATEQASSLEESSSALEELSGQAKGNAEIATETSGLMSAAKQTVGEMSVSIDEMVETMGGIKDSSGKISGILKTIEEIAFQTNLLALNAAVEAARAGEHGKGFAVVAEEVRNLAQRSAVAAKDTAALIESSVSQADKGAEVVTRVADDMHKVAESAGKVAENVDAIAQASQQQSEGIEQINNAVAQMDKVTQQVASNAEESASASEEMAAQSSQMHSIVGDLMVVVAGARSSGNASARQEIGLAHHAALSQKKQETKPPEAPKAAKAIPFDDDEQSGGDFSEF